MSETASSPLSQSLLLDNSNSSTSPGNLLSAGLFRIETCDVFDEAETCSLTNFSPWQHLLSVALSPGSEICPSPGAGCSAMAPVLAGGGLEWNVGKGHNGDRAVSQ